MSMVSCQKGPTRHAYAWQIGPFWQDTLDVRLAYTKSGPCRDSGLPTHIWWPSWYPDEEVLRGLVTATACTGMVIDNDFAIGHFDGLVQDCSNSSALAMELLQSCTPGGYSVRFWTGMLLTARRLETLQGSKRGVEIIHFAQFLWKIGVEIRHFPHFC